MIQVIGAKNVQICDEPHIKGKLVCPVCPVSNLLARFTMEWFSDPNVCVRFLLFFNWVFFVFIKPMHVGLKTTATVVKLSSLASRLTSTSACLQRKYSSVQLTLAKHTQTLQKHKVRKSIYPRQWQSHQSTNPIVRSQNVMNPPAHFRNTQRNLSLRSEQGELWKESPFQSRVFNALGVRCFD